VCTSPVTELSALAAECAAVVTAVSVENREVANKEAANKEAVNREEEAMAWKRPFLKQLRSSRLPPV
jgi:hypothetical protein